MSAFASIIRSAIVGTHQIAPPHAIGVPDADALLAPTTGEEPERTLLRTAAIIGTIRRSAKLPIHVETPKSDVAPDETLPRCGPLATADIRMMLDGERSAFLFEWLELASSFGRRIPEELLPKLLARGTNDRKFRRAILSVCGERGRWLAAYEPAWSYAIASESDAEAFANSTDRSARVRALEALRSEDPAEARATLENSWPSEAPDDRAALLAALEINLSLQDEPFLERAREDSRKEVRAVANDLLHRLPESQSAKRAIAWATPLLTLKRILFLSSLLLELPEACTPEMRADGMEPKFRPGRGPNLGDRAWWLRQLLEFVPLSHWRTAFKRTTTELLTLARAHDDYPMVLVGGFCAAIAAYRDEAALEELFALAATDAYYVETAIATRAAFPSATPSEAPFLEALKAENPDAKELVAAAARPWSVALSAAALDAARKNLEHNVDWQAHARRSAYFTLLAANVDPRTPGIAEGWPESYAAENTRDLVEKLVNTLLFRSAMLAHLKDDR
jgi:hypothetical protein